MTKLDYDKLSLQDALDMAILIEKEAEERYGELAEQLEQHRTPEAADFFRCMVENEAKHGKKLRDHRKQLFGDASSKVDATVIPEVEVTDYDEARAFMTPHQALRIAMANEVRAHDFYADALSQVKDVKIRELFEELRKEEVDHQEQIKRAQTKLGPEDKSNPDDFADEPVAQ